MQMLELLLLLLLQECLLLLLLLKCLLMRRLRGYDSKLLWLLLTHLSFRHRCCLRVHGLERVDGGGENGSVLLPLMDATAGIVIVGNAAPVATGVRTSPKNGLERKT